jgi:hypothetical protein
MSAILRATARAGRGSGDPARAPVAAGQGWLESPRIGVNR